MRAHSTCIDTSISVVHGLYIYYGVVHDGRSWARAAAQIRHNAQLLGMRARGQNQARVALPGVPLHLLDSGHARQVSADSVAGGIRLVLPGADSVARSHAVRAGLADEGALLQQRRSRIAELLRRAHVALDHRSVWDADHDHLHALPRRASARPRGRQHPQLRVLSARGAAGH